MYSKQILTPHSLKKLKTHVSSDLIEKAGQEEVHTGNLDHVAHHFLQKKSIYNKLIKKVKNDGGSAPFFIYEEQEFKKSIDDFKTTFSAVIPSIEIYYALKINHYKQCIHDAVKHGVNLEVASIRELKKALQTPCKKIVYFSPGKTDDDLRYALQHRKKVTIHIDSFNELHRLGKMTNKTKQSIKAGVRIYIPEHGSWNKYGIPLESLHLFWKEAEKYPHIDLQGIFFHTSRNKNADLYVQTIQKIGAHLKKYFTPSMLRKITYLDFGGGYDTNQTEGIFPESTQIGSLAKTVERITGTPMKFKYPYLIQKSFTLEQYAQTIAHALNTYIKPLVGDIRYFTEPGRILVNNAMHLLVQIEDVKEKNLAITGGGGVHMVGWQRFLFEYFVKINLTHPSPKEQVMTLSGSLCTTYDTWGKTCYGDTFEIGDSILIPYQGALTYTLAHEFINEIPPVYTIPLL